MRPPRADETDMENRRFLALSVFILSCLFCRVLPFLPRCFCLSCLSVCLVSLCVCCLVCLAFCLCVSQVPMCLAFFWPCLSVLSCLSCFFYDLMSCAVSCFSFWFLAARAAARSPTGLRPAPGP